jgi:hypothetical protein
LKPSCVKAPRQWRWTVRDSAPLHYDGLTDALNISATVDSQVGLTFPPSGFTPCQICTTPPSEWKSSVYMVWFGRYTGRTGSDESLRTASTSARVRGRACRSAACCRWRRRRRSEDKLPSSRPPGTRAIYELVAKSRRRCLCFFVSIRTMLAGRDKGAEPLQAAQPRLRAKRAPNFFGGLLRSEERGDAATLLELRLRASSFCQERKAALDSTFFLPLFSLPPPLSLPFSSGAALGAGSGVRG